MNSMFEFYYSSIGKKIVMSLTGLFLIVFLVEHLVGNLLLFANDGGVKYRSIRSVSCRESCDSIY